MFFHCFSFQTGLVRTSEEDFIIEPLPLHLAEKHNYQSQGDNHTPHVVYRRSALDQSQVSLAPGDEDADEETLEEKKPKAKRKKKKHRHRHRHVNGTKQHYCGRRRKCK